MKSSLRCNCGQRIFTRDVMQQGFYVRRFGPSFVYLKFRCSRCKKLGEHYVKQEDWDAGMLKDGALEISGSEKAQFETMGKITIDEMLSFHYELENLVKLTDGIVREVENES